MGVAYADSAWVREDVTAAKRGNDVVIVMMHWGREKQHELRDYQRVLGREAVEAGASLVIGTHPHISQGVELITRSVVAYSIGDGVFGGANKRREGSLVMRAAFGPEGLRTVEFLPLEASNVDSGWAPHLQEGDPAARTLELVRGLSASLGTRLEQGTTSEGFRCLRLDVTGVGAPASRN